MLTVEIDTRPAEQFLTDLEKRQLPFILMRTLNRTGLKVQEAEREELDDSFTLRRKDWAHRNVKIRREDFAKKNRLRVMVRMEAPGDGSRSDILAKFEESGTKRPKDGSRLAIPVDVKTTRVGIVQKNQRPRSFDFVHVGGNVWRGEKRTFMIRRPDGTGGIYQRTGRRGRRRKDGSRGRGAGRRQASDISTRKVRDLNVRTLFRFTPLARIEKRLQFEDTARRVVLDVWNPTFFEEFRNAMRTAR